MLIIRIRLPIISSGARVPMRSETWTKRWTALMSLVRRTISSPGLQAVEVAERERLDLEEERLAQVACHALAHLDREVMLLPTAITAESAEMPSMIRPVWTTTAWSWR